MQINRKCDHLSALKPLRSFGPTQRGGATLVYIIIIYTNLMIAFPHTTSVLAKVHI